MVMVDRPDPGAAIVVGLKLTVTPMGIPEAERIMELLKPPPIVVAIVDTPWPFSGILIDDGVAETVKVPVADNGRVKNKLSRQRRKSAPLLRNTMPIIRSAILPWRP